MDHAGRRSRLSARLPELEADAFLVTRLVNVRYLTGFTGSNGQLLLFADGARFFTDSRYEEQSRREVPDVERAVYPAKLEAVLGDACREGGVKRLGFEAGGVTFETYTRLEEAVEAALVPVGDQVERLRWVKDAEEIALMRRAQELTDDAFDRVTSKLVEEVSEREVAFELELAMREGGAERVAFDVICAFGEQAAEPHHDPTDRRLARGDVIKMDFGCVVDGYHSDMTRTVSLGEPDPRVREIHEVVARAHQAGIDAVRAGARGGACDAAARAVIEEAGYGDRFGHSLGHGVGLEIHEGPTLRKESEDVLPAGTVVTVEPGIYVPGIGGVRIEDMVLVGPDGAGPMPRSPRDLIVL